MVRLERDDVARGVVEQRVDAHGVGLAVDQDDAGVADVAVPQRAGTLCLPAQADACGDVAPGAAVEAMRAVEAAHGGRRDRAWLETAVRHQGAQDERHRGARVLAADVEQQIALRGRERAAATAIGTRARHERVEATTAQRVVPALQGRDGVGARGVCAGRTQALRGDLAQCRRQLAARDLAAGEAADHLGAKQGDLLGAVLGRESVHRSPLLAPRRSAAAGPET